MSFLARSRTAIGSMFVIVGALGVGVSCYQAEIDLAPLVDGQSQTSGGAPLSEAGQSGGGEPQTSGGAPRSEAGQSGGGGSGEPAGGAAGDGAAGQAGAPTCDPTREDEVQHRCRIRPEPIEVCDEQDSPGWAGCYAGGCSVCTEVLVDYPYYLKRHPCCQPNDACSVHQPVKCARFCPPPTELDKLPLCFELAR